MIAPATEGAAQRPLPARFADERTEARFQLTARTLRLPFIRVYGVVVMLVMLGYSVANPLFLPDDELPPLAILSGVAMGVLGAYVAATFWRGYGERAMMDFVALMALSLTIAAINVHLFEVLLRLHQDMHAVGVVNRLAVSAFAAVALAGRLRLFAIWMALDLAAFLLFVLPVQVPGTGLAYALLSHASGALVMIAINIAIDRSSRGSFALAHALDEERGKVEAMLQNMLPPLAAERLRRGELVADSFADTSVVFIDMVGFSSLAKKVSPGHLVELLNAFFSHADRCAEAEGVEKVKTIGDAYLAIAGGNVAAGNSADAAIGFARAVLEGLPSVRAATGVAFDLRIGIHSGPVVGGIIGENRMAYDYWGETMNIASRVEGTASPGGIAISETTWLRARDRSAFGAPETHMLKGVGETIVFQSLPQPARTGVAAAA